LFLVLAQYICTFIDIFSVLYVVKRNKMAVVLEIVVIIG